MVTTDPPTGSPLEYSADDATTGSEQVQLPNLRELRWPVVQALRAFDGAASDLEIGEHVANAMALTQQQRTAMIPSGQETKLKNRVGWTVHELKEIGVLHYPQPGRRALTPFGLEVDQEQIKALRDAFEASKASSGSDQPDDQEQLEIPAVWLIRAGGQGELAESFIEDGIAAVGFGQLPDLSEVSNREEIAELVRKESREFSEAQVRARVDQLWTLRSRVRRGDLIVMPHKANLQFALGTVTRRYWYRSDTVMMHTVSVDWEAHQRAAHGNGARSLEIAGSSTHDQLDKGRRESTTSPPTTGDGSRSGRPGW